MDEPQVISIEPELDELRLAALLRQAPIEFARVVYGLADLNNGEKHSLAAQDVLRVQAQGMAITRERAEQRARAYLPTNGHEHCPRCWVLTGVKNPLRFRLETQERPESSICVVCGAEYTNNLD